MTFTSRPGKDALSIFSACFGAPRALIGMLHVGALPGTPAACHSIDRLIEQTVAEARIYRDAGFTALALENMHDRPYLKGAVGPEITAAMTVLAHEVKRETGLVVGIQVLAAANREALAVALASGAEFVRVEGFVFAHVADEGVIESCAGELLRYRRTIGAERVLVFADIKKKHGAHAITSDVSLAATARAAELFLADGVIVTGAASGEEASPDDVRDTVASRRSTGARGFGRLDPEPGPLHRRARIHRGILAEAGRGLEQPPRSRGRGGPGSSLREVDVRRGAALPRAARAISSSTTSCFRTAAPAWASPAAPSCTGPWAQRSGGRAWGVSAWSARTTPSTMLDALEERRVDLTGVHRLGGPGVRTWLLYEGQSRRLIHRLGCPTHEQVSPGPEHIPPAWHSAPAFHLAPMPFAVQRRVLGVSDWQRNRFVSIDPHLPVTEETLGDWRNALADADAFFPGRGRAASGGDARRPAAGASPSGKRAPQVHRVQAGCERRHSVRRPRRALPSMAARVDGGRRSHRRWRCLRGGLHLRRTSRGFPYRPASTVASSVQASLSRLGGRRRCSRQHAPMPTLGSAGCLRPGRARDGSIRRRR